MTEVGQEYWHRIRGEGGGELRTNLSYNREFNNSFIFEILKSMSRKNLFIYSSVNIFELN